MAIPALGSRGDIVVAVEFDPVGAPGVYTNWCGATNISFEVSNEVITQNVGDCDDWGLPVQTNRSYGPQGVTMNFDATWTAAQHTLTTDWAFNQRTLNVQVNFPNATTGNVSQYGGAALLSSMSLGNIGNTDGNPQTETVALEFSGAVTRTLAP